VLRSSTVLSYLDGFRIIALLLVLAAPLVWLMHKPKPGAKAKGAAAAE
jgi:hypothetical protein